MASGLRWRAASGLIGDLFDDGPAAGLGDDQLIARFAARRADAEGAERAFDAIVRRHGPMVLSACRRALGDRHDAEDAFQATFLVLARRAGSLRDPARLAPWLLGVARRTARKARARRARRDRLERRIGSIGAVAVEPPPRADRADEAELVREAIAALPEKYQGPLILCDLQGLTQAEAAARLRCPIGTVGVRLARGRSRLRDRLARRGVTTAGLAAPPLPTPADDLVARTRHAALDFASDAPAGTGPALSIARGVLRAMTLKTLTLGLVAFTALGLAAAGLALAQAPATTKAPPAKKPDDGPKSLLANGGLERPGPDGKSPASWARGAAIPGVEYGWDRAEAHRGKASLRIAKTAQRYFPIAQWSQTFERVGDAPALRVAASVKADRMTKAVLDVQFLDEAGAPIKHEWAATIGAKAADAPPATHDWTPYSGTVAIPAGTRAIVVAAQVYGPGTVWFDDLAADYSNAAPESKQEQEQARADPDDLSGVVTYAAEAGGDPRKTYFVSRGPDPDGMPPGGDGAPPDGHRLLVVLPGGDGGPDFLPFVRRIARDAVPPGTLVVQLKSVAWTPEQAKQVVWPTANDDLPGVGFTTEAFLDAVVAEVRGKRRVDPRRVVALGWSSSGPAVYAAMLRPSTPLAGAFVAMSVFQPGRLPPLPTALGRSFYLLHSPDDRLIPLSLPESARDSLRRAGASVELQTYDGGHGWHGDALGSIRRGLDWLDAHPPAPRGG